jgi:formylglycine-generating enzyme required for sulfatase activity
VARALAKKPEDRWPSCRAFAEALPGGTAAAEVVPVAVSIITPAERRPGKVVINSLGMKFAWCPPGTFFMGSPAGEEDRGDDEAQHPVTLSRGFYLAVHPVTQVEWASVMGGNPSKFKGDDRPVEGVSWDDSQEFCRRLSGRDGQRYRLPTEAEWEYACRAGTVTPFCFGRTLSTEVANYDGTYSYGRGKKGVYRQQTTPVESFPPNGWGLYDMHGNVWEWCQDAYAPYPNSTVKNLPTQGKPQRVLRGGSWYDAPRFCRSAARFHYASNVHNDDVGFRVVLVANP